MMENLRIWVMSLLEYDKFGRATVLKSFAKPAADSPIKAPKKGSYAKNKNAKPKNSVIQNKVEEELF